MDLVALLSVHGLSEMNFYLVYIAPCVILQCALFLHSTGTAVFKGIHTDSWCYHGRLMLVHNQPLYSDTNASHAFSIKHSLCRRKTCSFVCCPCWVLEAVQYLPTSFWRFLWLSEAIRLIDFNQCYLVISVRLFLADNNTSFWFHAVA